MSTKPAKPVKPPMAIKELGEVLVKHYGLKEGKYEVLIEFAIGMGSAGSTPETRLPGVMVGLKSIGLVKTEQDGPLTIDADKLK